MRFPKAYSYQSIVRVFILCLLLPLFVQGQHSALVTHEDVQRSFNLIFSDPDSAYNVLMGLEGRSKLQPDSLHAIVLNHLGVYHAVQGKSQEAIAYFEQSLAQLDEGSKRKATTLNNLAIVYKNIGNYALALKVLGNAEDAAIEKYKSMNMALVENLFNPDLKLTRGDVEFCLLLSMRLQTKEIASILSISLSSVSTKKYRLIKKLNLDSDMDLDQWLQDMNTDNGV